MPLKEIPVDSISIGSNDWVAVRLILYLRANDMWQVKHLNGLTLVSGSPD